MEFSNKQYAAVQICSRHCAGNTVEQSKRRSGVFERVLIVAMLVGAEAPPPTSSSGRRFGELLQSSLQGHVTAACWSLVEEVLERQQLAVEMARRGRVNMATDQLCRVRERRDQGGFGAGIREVTEALLLPAEAYCRYRVGDYAGARQRLRRAWHADDAVVRIFAAPSLYAHRLLLIENAVRVDVRARRMRHAQRLAAATVRALDARCTRADQRREGQSAWMDGVPMELCLEARSRLAQQWRVEDVLP